MPSLESSSWGFSFMVPGQFSFFFMERVTAIELYITGQRRKTQQILFRGVKRFVRQRRQE